LAARLMTLLCKKNIVAISKEVKTGCNLAEFSMKGYGSKMAVLMMMMMMMMMMRTIIMFSVSNLWNRNLIGVKRNIYRRRKASFS
jgi:hypothetical protein